MNIRPLVPGAICLLPLCLFLTSASAVAQQDDCGPLTEILKFGADETEVNSTRDEARRLYRFACNEESRVNQRTNSASVNASYNLFSAGAKNNSATVDEYREKHCSLLEDDATALVAESFRQRRVNPAAVAAWSACRAETGVLLDPRLDANQKVASFSITYDSRRLPGVPTLRGINAPTFSCTKAGSGEAIGVGGDAIELSPTEALVVRCDRTPETIEIGDRSATLYRDASLILDLSTGGHRIDFAERREGPAVDEFAALQERIRDLNAALRALEGRARRLIDIRRIRSFVRTPGQNAPPDWEGPDLIAPRVPAGAAVHEVPLTCRPDYDAVDAWYSQAGGDFLSTLEVRVGDDGGVEAEVRANRGSSDADYLDVFVLCRARQEQ